MVLVQGMNTPDFGWDHEGLRFYSGLITIGLRTGQVRKPENKAEHEVRGHNGQEIKQRAGSRDKLSQGARGSGRVSSQRVSKVK